MSAAANSGLVRILFRLDTASWHTNATERLWAQPVGNDRYRLRNVPFFAYGVSNEDIVFGENADGQLTFSGVSIRGGHSTYRIRMLPSHGEVDFQQYWKPLDALGCTYERGDGVIAVDIPPLTDIYAAYRLLEAGVSSAVWDFEEGDCGHPLHERTVDDV